MTNDKGMELWFGQVRGEVIAMLGKTRIVSMNPEAADLMAKQIVRLAESAREWREATRPEAAA